jgi:hypothetical protein
MYTKMKCYSKNAVVYFEVAFNMYASQFNISITCRCSKKWM